MGYCNGCIRSVIFMLCSNWPLCCFRCFCLKKKKYIYPLTSHAIYTAAKGCFRYCQSKYENLLVYILVLIKCPHSARFLSMISQNYSANAQLQFPGIISVITRSVHQVNKSAVFSVLRHNNPNPKIYWLLYRCLRQIPQFQKGWLSVLWSWTWSQKENTERDK